MVMLLPIAASVLLAAGGPRLARALAPAMAVRLLTLAALVTALAGGFVLSVIAFTFVAQNADVAAAGRWSVPILRRVAPVPPVLGIAAAVGVTALLTAALVRTGRAVRDLVIAALAFHRLGSGVHGLVIVEDTRPEAYALPGITGRVVVSTSMLQVLPAAERRAVLAHEASHLTHRHHLYVLAADIAAAANPLVRCVPGLVRLGIERWADEDAAFELGDRRIVARALARVARAAAGRTNAPSVALAMRDSALVDRARALLEPPRRPRRSVAVLLLAVTAATALSVPVVARTTEGNFEQAQAIQI